MEQPLTPEQKMEQNARLKEADASLYREFAPFAANGRTRRLMLTKAVQLENEAHNAMLFVKGRAILNGPEAA